RGRAEAENLQVWATAFTNCAMMTRDVLLSLSIHLIASLTPRYNGQVISFSAVPVLATHTIPILLVNLYLTLREFSVKPDMLQLNLDTVASDAVKEEIVRR
ncbi:hypothetical protein THAOC_29084, partial [Thalassiosira oceanica]